MPALNPSDWAVRHRGVAGFLIALVFFAGAWSYLHLGRAEDPDFTVKLAIVSTTWPGATAQQVQDQVADRLEHRLHELPWLDHLDTYSLPGASVTQVWLRDATPPRDVAGLWYQLRKKLDDLRPSLPAGVNVAVNDEYSDIYGNLFALTGADNATLVRAAEHVRDALQRVAGAEKLLIVGEVPRKVFVDFDPGRLAARGVSVAGLAQAVGAQNLVAPAGMFQSGALRVPLRVDGALDGATTVANVPVALNGNVVRLGDLADVHAGYADPPDFAVRFNGRPAVVLAVSMAAGVNGLEFGRRLSAAAKAAAAGLPLGIELRQIENQSAVIDDAVGEYLLKFAVAVGVVLLASFVSLGWRAGMVVALSIPLTLAMVFLVLDALGIALQRVSLGALIIALGLLVDDAIIAVEMMEVKLREGLGRREAAGVAWNLTAAPMLAGTLVTAASFLPVGLARSSTGEYAGGICWVVALALVCSFVVAMVFAPVLGVTLLRPPPAAAPLYPGSPYRVLRRVVDWSVRHRVLVVVCTGLAFLVAGAGMLDVRQQFFPASTRDELVVDVALRAGSSFAATEAAVAAVESHLRGDPDVRWFSSYIGAGPPRFFLSALPALPNPAVATIVIVARDAAAREHVRARMLALTDANAVPAARLRASRLELGPPVGFPVSFRVTGPALAEVRRIGDQVLDVLRSTPGTRDVQLAWGDAAPALRVALAQARIGKLGADPAAIQQRLQTLLTGTPVTALRDGNKLIDVVLRAAGSDRLDPQRLPDLTVPTAYGAVPLAQLARIVPEMEAPILWRRDSMPYIAVQSDVSDAVQAPDVSAAVRRRLAPVEAALPPGYRIETGGAAEESGKANTALFRVFPLMGAIIAVLLMLQLQNVRRMLLVLATAPLGIIGAAPALLIADASLGFVALLGLIALGGMIMRNSLILVDQVRRDVAAGAPLSDAIVAASVRRARPVALTAAAAVLAFVPLSFNMFWGPMAITMIGGLVVATALTLVFEPALYALTAGVGWRPGDG